MNWSAVGIVYRKELRDTLRDRRTLISTIVVPTLLMPALIFGITLVAGRVVRQAGAELPTVMVLGGEDSPRLMEALRAADTFRIVPPAPDFARQISERSLRAAVEIPDGFDAELAQGRAPPVRIYHYQGELRSTRGRSALEEFFTRYRQAAVAEALAARGLPDTLLRPFAIESENVAPPERVGGNAIGGFIPYLIVLLCFTGAMYPAMDLTAGEKERGTMETLLCSPVSRIHLVLGKFLMTLTASLTTMLISVVMLGVSIAVAARTLPGSGGALAEVAAEAPLLPTIDPWGLLGVLVLILPVAVFFSAILLAVSLFAKSFKEAQSYVSPLIVLVILPAVLGTLPGMELSGRTALVPILNLSLAGKEMLSGIWSWPVLVAILGSYVFYATVGLWLCVRMFNREDVIFRA